MTIQSRRFVSPARRTTPMLSSKTKHHRPTRHVANSTVTVHPTIARHRPAHSWSKPRQQQPRQLFKIQERNSRATSFKRCRTHQRNQTTLPCSPTRNRTQLGTDHAAQRTRLIAQRASASIGHHRCPTPQTEWDRPRSARPAFEAVPVSSHCPGAKAHPSLIVGGEPSTRPSPTHWCSSHATMRPAKMRPAISPFGAPYPVTNA